MQKGKQKLLIPLVIGVLLLLGIGLAYILYNPADQLKQQIDENINKQNQTQKILIELEILKDQQQVQLDKTLMKIQSQKIYLEKLESEKKKLQEKLRKYIKNE